MKIQTNDFAVLLSTNIKTSCISKVMFLQMFNIAQQDSYDSLVSLRDQSTHTYRHMDGDTKHSGERNHLEQTLSMVASGVVGNQNNMLDYSEIWLHPNSENFTQCIERTKSQKLVDAKTNGYLLINANGGLNQMRFGVWLL